MSNSSNISYLNSLLLANMRTTYFLDSLRFYLTTPMAIIGTILNTISFIILSAKSFSKINIFKLMKVYNLASLLLTFGLTFSFLNSPNIFFDLSISMISRIYTCYFLNWFIILIFVYGNCLDILMNLERALSYSNGYRNIKKISPYLICFIVLIICAVIHLPSDLAMTHTPDDQLYTKLNLCYSTTFAFESVTRMILIVSYIIEGPIVMILVIASNILAYISFKSFLKRKNESVNIKRSAELTEREKTKQAKTEKMNQKLLKMTIYLTIFSIITHFIQFGAQLIVYVFNAKVNSIFFGWTRFAYIFIVIFKHFFTPFFYYYFNRNFKDKILSLFCKKKSPNTVIESRNNNINNR
jgi:hypothetical protein